MVNGSPPILPHNALQVALYARVSTDGQDPEVQLQALRAHAAHRGWEIIETFVDHGVSGRLERRPALDRMIKTAWVGQFQIIVVQRLDRLGRSLKHLVTLLSELQEKGVAVVSLKEQLDFSSSTGRLLFHVIAALAEFETALIADRVRAGLDRARMRGVRLGRPIAQAKPDEVAVLKQQGLSVPEIAKSLRCSRSTIKRRLREKQRFSLTESPLL
jgi:DNA invertase Pin-like site-specific DNA recombinase